ncbi:hypothetical protein COCCU_14530 (plasmid) [Corynebacterium occultum]|uniref:Secreted protein n=1 Tax=Corynebacterium occultum TaxID=2675219 RepID=A0A6B8WD62_9CORY|nr:hypothetical protein COCCU_14530 [Corynebacterium occultum]
MKQKLAALALAFSVTTGAMQAAPASAQDTGVPSASSFSSSEQGSSAGSAVTFLALVAALGGGSLWAVQQGLIANPLPGVIPSPPRPSPAPSPIPRRGDCSPQAFNNTLAPWRDSNQTVVQYCDGHFAWVSQSQTDWRVPFEFDGQRWKVFPRSGTTKTGLTQGCYNGIELRHRGASEAFISRIPICTPDEIGYSP